MGGHPGQNGDGIVVRLAPQTVEDVPNVQDMVVDPNRVESQLLGCGADIHHVIRVVQAEVVGDYETEFHRLASLDRVQNCVDLCDLLVDQVPADGLGVGNHLFDFGRPLRSRN